MTDVPRVPKATLAAPKGSQDMPLLDTPVQLIQVLWLSINARASAEDTLDSLMQ